jgi:glycosyltransferase involved in cell wall biosynthesis
MISGVILAKNEEKEIEACIKSLSWCDEILVIDDASTDNTPVIAQKLGVKVQHHPMRDFASQRNFAMERAKGEWVLFVDADERVSNALKQEINHQLAKDNDIKGYFLKRLDVMWGRELNYGETANIRLLRLGRKDFGSWRGKIHETWKITGKTVELSNPLVHYPHQSISEFLTKINIYSDMRASELYEEKIITNAFLIIFYPKAKFVLNYIIRLGFLDGIPGLIHALMMSMHSFLVRGKLWLLWQKKVSS